MANDKTRYGMVCAIGAQVIWGLFPIYVDLLRSIDAVAFVAHRAIWSFVFLLSVFLVAKFVKRPWLPSFQELRFALGSRRILTSCAIAAILIAINWIGFVWAVNHDHKVDASLGYYICPQVVVLLGVVFLGERLNLIQWVAVGLTVIGVGYMVQTSAGMPSISLAIAFSFGFYALVKKKAKLSALSGLTFETGCLLIPAIAFLAYHTGYIDVPFVNANDVVGQVEEVPLFANTWWLSLLLVGSGICTVAPLALYATAVKHIPLATIGLLQFIGPTIQFFIGVFLFKESFDYTRLIGFLVVWTGVVLYLYALRKPKPSSRGRS
ncbi:MAG: EamA family transporter RarD [Mariniblastus sp.]|nr:EamA family transporter RarD [Mariniblastus sp.]